MRYFTKELVSNLKNCQFHIYIYTHVCTQCMCIYTHTCIYIQYYEKTNMAKILIDKFKWQIYTSSLYVYFYEVQKNFKLKSWRKKSPTCILQLRSCLTLNYCDKLSDANCMIKLKVIQLQNGTFLKRHIFFTYRHTQGEKSQVQAVVGIW